VDKGAVSFGSSVNSRIFLVGSKPRNDQGFSWFWEEVVQAWSWFGDMEKKIDEQAWVVSSNVNFLALSEFC